MILKKLSVSFDGERPARTRFGSPARLRTCWLVKCFALSRTILLDSVEFGKVKLKSDFKNLHNYLKINILAKKAKNTEGVTSQQNFESYK
jgi:hypothetical protein